MFQEFGQRLALVRLVLRISGCWKLRLAVAFIYVSVAISCPRSFVDQKRGEVLGGGSALLAYVTALKILGLGARAEVPPSQDTCVVAFS